MRKRRDLGRVFFIVNLRRRILKARIRLISKTFVDGEKMIRAIIFDFNGVIINDEPHSAESLPGRNERRRHLIYRRRLLQMRRDERYRFVQRQFENTGKEVSDERVREIIAEKNRKLAKDRRCGNCRCLKALRILSRNAVRDLLLESSAWRISPKSNIF